MRSPTPILWVLSGIVVSKWHLQLYINPNNGSLRLSHNINDFANNLLFHMMPDNKIIGNDFSLNDLFAVGRYGNIADCNLSQLLGVPGKSIQSCSGPAFRI